MFKKFIFLTLSIIIAGYIFFTSEVSMAQDGTEEITLAALEEISDQIMSPGCDYKYTLTNCPSVQAVELRDLIKGKLAAGETKEEIMKYLFDIYGPRILAAPEKKGFFLLAWWVPYFVIADGALIIAIIIVFWRRGASRLKTTVSDQGDKEQHHIYDEKIEEELKKMDL